MTRKPSINAAALALALTASFYSQPCRAQATASTSSTVTAINEKLNAARARVASGQSSLVSHAATTAALAAKADAAAQRSTQPADPVAAAREAQSQQRLDAAMANVSPQGKQLLAQNTVPLALPVEEPPSTSPTRATSAAGPKPTALKPAPLTQPKKEAADTTINADEMYFDGSGSIIVYVGNVDVRKPGLHITCDEFEVHMKKEPKAGATPPAKSAAKSAPTVAALANAPAKTVPGATPPAKAPEKSSTEENIETAIARGRMVVIEKKGTEGEAQIGQCREATYDGATGNIYLRVWPQVQKGNSIISAAEETTLMTLTAAGDFSAKGRTKSLLANTKDKDGKPLPQKGGLSLPVPAPGQ
jgi:lipopolysaccharide export system protein LptA